MVWGEFSWVYFGSLAEECQDAKISTHRETSMT